MTASTDYQLAKADHFYLICKENVNTQESICRLPEVSQDSYVSNKRSQLIKAFPRVKHSACEINSIHLTACLHTEHAFVPQMFPNNGLQSALSISWAPFTEWG